MTDELARVHDQRDQRLADVEPDRGPADDTRGAGQETDGPGGRMTGRLRTEGDDMEKKQKVSHFVVFFVESPARSFSRPFSYEGSLRERFRVVRLLLRGVALDLHRQGGPAMIRTAVLALALVFVAAGPGPTEDLGALSFVRG